MYLCEKFVDMTAIGPVSIKIPTIMESDAMTLPQNVSGIISPYPTVDSVTIPNHMLFGMVSKSLCESPSIMYIKEPAKEREPVRGSLCD